MHTYTTPTLALCAAINSFHSTLSLSPSHTFTTPSFHLSLARSTIYTRLALSFMQRALHAREGERERCSTAIYRAVSPPPFCWNIPPLGSSSAAAARPRSLARTAREKRGAVNEKSFCQWSDVSPAAPLALRLAYHVTAGQSPREYDTPSFSFRGLRLRARVSRSRACTYIPLSLSLALALYTRLYAMYLCYIPSLSLGRVLNAPRENQNYLLLFLCFAHAARAHWRKIHRSPSLSRVQFARTHTRTYIYIHTRYLLYIPMQAIHTYIRTYTQRRGTLEETLSSPFRRTHAYIGAHRVSLSREEAAAAARRRERRRGDPRASARAVGAQSSGLCEPSWGLSRAEAQRVQRERGKRTSPRRVVGGRESARTDGSRLQCVCVGVACIVCLYSAWCDSSI